MAAPARNKSWVIAGGYSHPDRRISESGFGAVAQLGEHRLCKPGVAGSIPVRSTSIRNRTR